MANNKINDVKICRWIAGNFDCHANAAVRHGAHRPMEQIQGFTRSHWMPPLGECLCPIVLVAPMVDEFVETTQNTTKTQLLASNYGTFQLLAVCENFTPKRTLYSAHWYAKLRKNVRLHNWSWRAQLNFELSNIVSGQKLGKLLTYHEAHLKNGCITISATIGFLLTA